ncbi:sirohydrochlorin nickelochelatase [Methanocella sp. CWC-04]|uniref:Sirohydrochlorin cobaltochelatase n=1 Tax=Methanooceanicella nereidis TaxID=2052831 RepID=A0AAP2W731_9EURY|nr:sirohydrochlorin nickelochelatase [Methanocella sp. CWC-04]MCD1295978.1 sirohydrochlorin nickelochelatase [Methanocella sp. CWC-04]
MDDEKFGLLVVGHGSSMPYNKELIEDIAGRLSKKIPNAVTRVGFMNINKPSIKDGIDSFKDTGVKKIVVFPLFLAKGVHTKEDVPGLIGLTEGQKRINYDGYDIVYADPLGADDLIAELSTKRIQEAYTIYNPN